MFFDVFYVSYVFKFSFEYFLMFFMVFGLFSCCFYVFCSLKFEMFYAFLHAPLDLSFFLVLCFSIFCFLTFSPSMSHVIEYFVVEY